MNLKIKCDTPKEQVLVLRKFKKLVPECKWGDGRSLLDFIPFIDQELDSCYIHLTNQKATFGSPASGAINLNNASEYSASYFLHDDWKLETDKSEGEALFLEIQKTIDNFNKSLRKLEESLRAKYKL